jgi:hypothetical protein
MKAQWLVYVPPNLTVEKALYFAYKAHLSIPYDSQNKGRYFPKQHFFIIL